MAADFIAGAGHSLGRPPTSLEGRGSRISVRRPGASVKATPEKRFGRGGQILVPQLRPTLSEDTDIHGLRMSIDPTIMVLWLRVEVHPGLLLGGGKLGYSHHTAALRSRGGLDGYQSAALDRGPVAVRKKREKTRSGRGG
jgi:hypothetical protein